MIEVLLIVLILTIFKKAQVNIRPQLKDLETSVSKFDFVLDKSGKN